MNTVQLHCSCFPSRYYGRVQMTLGTAVFQKWALLGHGPFEDLQSYFRHAEHVVGAQICFYLHCDICEILSVAAQCLVLGKMAHLYACGPCPLSINRQSFMPEMGIVCVWCILYTSSTEKRNISNIICGYSPCVWVAPSSINIIITALQLRAIPFSPSFGFHHVITPVLCFLL